MPAQLPAGGPGAEAPREQPASPTTDDAPPPVKQEYTGAQGAEIAGSADSASAGPGASDSLHHPQPHQWVFDDNDELVPATELNVGAYGDDDAVWYDAEVVKVMKRLVEVFYPADDATRRHNLLVSGITDKSPEPFENYMAKGVRWKVKD